MAGLDDMTQRAIALAGGSKQLAEHLGVTRQAIEQWRRIPPRHVLTIERLTGLSRYDLRPDIYGDGPGPFARRAEAAAA